MRSYGIKEVYIKIFSCQVESIPKSVFSDPFQIGYLIQFQKCVS